MGWIFPEVIHLVLCTYREHQIRRESGGQRGQLLVSTADLTTCS